MGNNVAVLVHVVALNDVVRTTLIRGGKLYSLMHNLQLCA